MTAIGLHPVPTLPLDDPQPAEPAHGASGGEEEEFDAQNVPDRFDMRD